MNPLIENISWLKNKVQEDLFSYLQGCFAKLSPAEARRYNERAVAERTNSGLKCSFGGEDVMVRGAAKVKLHLMFGLIALFADQLMKLTS